MPSALIAQLLVGLDAFDHDQRAEMALVPHTQSVGGRSLSMPSGGSIDLHLLRREIMQIARSMAGAEIVQRNSHRWRATGTHVWVDWVLRNGDVR